MTRDAIACPVISLDDRHLDVGGGGAASRTHAFIEADATVGGRTERWSIEMTSPNNLTQSGWKRTTLRGGEKVTLYVHPLRGGAKGGSYVGVVLPDGKTLGEVG